MHSRHFAEASTHTEYRQVFGRHFIVISNYEAKASGSHVSVARGGLDGSNCPKKVAGGLLN